MTTNTPNADSVRSGVMAGATYVAIYTDGMGTWQARCLSCAWRGPWRKRDGEHRAVEDAAVHVDHLQGTNDDCNSAAQIDG